MHTYHHTAEQKLKNVERKESNRVVVGGKSVRVCALFGAIFLDAGFDVARKAIAKLYLPVLVTVDPKTLGKDAKTLLQEYLQGRKIALPTYNVVATRGAAHNQEFEVECLIPKLEIRATGAGASRRAAEQAAAKKALELAPKEAPKKSRRARKDNVKPLPVVHRMNDVADAREVALETQQGDATDGPGGSEPSSTIATSGTDSKS